MRLDTDSELLIKAYADIGRDVGAREELTAVAMSTLRENITSRPILNSADARKQLLLRADQTVVAFSKALPLMRADIASSPLLTDLAKKGALPVTAPKLREPRIGFIYFTYESQTADIKKTIRAATINGPLGPVFNALLKLSHCGMISLFEIALVSHLWKEMASGQKHEYRLTLEARREALKQQTGFSDAQIEVLDRPVVQKAIENYLNALRTDQFLSKRQKQSEPAR